MKKLLTSALAFIALSTLAFAGTSDSFTGPANFESGSKPHFKTGSTTTVDVGASIPGLCRRVYLGTPAVAAVATIVTSTNLKVGAYTVADTTPDGTIPRNITVTRTAVSTADTGGTILVTGTDGNGDTLTETISVGGDGVTVAGLKAFKTVTSVVGAGWVIAAGNDTVTVGFGNLVGLPFIVPSSASYAYALTTLDTTVASSVVTGGTRATSTVNASAGTFNASKKLFIYIDR